MDYKNKYLKYKKKYKELKNINNQIGGQYNSEFFPDKIENNKFYLGLCKLNNEQLKLAYDNPHCVEYFCNANNLLNCTSCYQEFSRKNIFKMGDKMSNLQQEQIISKAYQKDIKNIMKMKCNHKCYTNGLVYGTAKEDWEEPQNHNIDSFRSMDNFYQDKLITTLQELPQVPDYESTPPKPKTVVHYGQIKMFLVTIIFLLQTIEPSDKIVNIIYPGSARGDNILILCEMFPNTRWYLTDPQYFHPDLHKHKQVLECANEFMTEEKAKKYSELFKDRKDKLLFFSDIRLATTDEAVMKDQENNIIWHNIIKPDYSFFKFRCPFNEKKYDYYDGPIYFQPYGPVITTETRILLTTNLKKKTYDVHEYQSQMNFFNRVLRPSYYQTNINHQYLDHCWDCVCFRKLMEQYVVKFNKKESVETVMNNILSKITERTQNKIKLSIDNIRKNIINKQFNITEQKSFTGKRYIKN